MRIIKFLEVIVQVITWLITNGIPFVRGIIEEIKAAKAKSAFKKAARK